MVQKKIRIIRNWILNYIQSATINEIVKHMPVGRNVVMAVNILTNLDQLSVIQYAILKMGIYKFWAYAIYFLFLA